MDESVQHLTEQIGFLLKSARVFDNGDLTDAKRLATHIRTLVHETATSHALLNQCGVLKTMVFGDSATPIDPANMLSSHALTAKIVGPSGIKYGASLRPVHRWLPFDDWWQAVVINIPPLDGHAKAKTMTRRYLVLEVANTDGGTHVGRMKRMYEDLSRNNLLGWTGHRGDETYSLGNPALGAVRKITYEVLESIEYEFPGLVRGHRDNDPEVF